MSLCGFFKSFQLIDVKQRLCRIRLSIDALFLKLNASEQWNTYINMKKHPFFTTFPNAVLKITKNHKPTERIYDPWCKTKLLSDDFVYRRYISRNIRFNTQKHVHLIKIIKNGYIMTYKTKYPYTFCIKNTPFDAQSFRDSEFASFSQNSFFYPLFLIKKLPLPHAKK